MRKTLSILLFSICMLSVCSCYHSTCSCICSKAGTQGKSYNLEKDDCANYEARNKQMATQYGWDTCQCALDR